jgi:hypothetical protein
MMKMKGKGTLPLKQNKELVQMAKKATEKKEFAWDSEVLIRTLSDDKVRHEIKICTLNGKKFLVDTKLAFFQKDGWKPVKNSTMELLIFEAAADAVSEWKLKEAFGGSSAVSVSVDAEEPAPKKRTMKGKKTETVEAKEKAKPKRTRKTAGK